MVLASTPSEFVAHPLAVGRVRFHCLPDLFRSRNVDSRVPIHTSATDVLGYLSSVSRGNPDIQFPREGSTLGGSTRARYIKSVKVNIGYFGVGSAEAGRLGSLQRIRFSTRGRRNHISRREHSARRIGVSSVVVGTSQPASIIALTEVIRPE